MTVFLLPHQDDEFGVFHSMEAERKRGRRVLCAFMTSGVPPGGDPSRRNAESVEVLAALDVHEVVFVGAELNIADGHLREALTQAGKWIERLMDTESSLSSIFVPAWEGGHPDHDCLHALVAEIAEHRGKITSIYQFPLYNGYRLPGPLFRVLTPLATNGLVRRDRIPTAKRAYYLKLVLCYRSQVKTWMGLIPFVLLHYLLKGTQDLQGVQASRTHQKPHAGRLYYERRGFARWDEVDSAINAWRLERLTGTARIHAVTREAGPGNSKP